MSPCSPSDVSIDIPTGPSGPAIPGFGTPFALKLPDRNPFPAGFPEDLLDILNKLQLLIPPGALKPALNPNYGKDVFDGIMKLLDQFFPFLMLYKFFLPILNLIICIIEVLCSMSNPFKLIRAMKRLFRNCIPDFLNLFPIFALIIMIISLLLLLLALIEYIVNQVLKMIKMILRNITALEKSFQDNDQNAVLSIAKKIGSLLCIFQNLFVMLSIFNIIIQVIREMLSLIFSIPPCDDSDPSDLDGCCTPDVCPAFIKAPYTNFKGTFKYINKVSILTSLVLPPPFGNFNVAARPESWQLFDINQNQIQQFRNVFDAYDVTLTPKPLFFPTDITYSKDSNPKQVVYALDLRLFYNPHSWGRTGAARYIRFKDCIMTVTPTTELSNYDNSTTEVYNGVVILAGGTGYEDNGTTVLKGYDTNGITPINSNATLENFLHKPDVISVSPIFAPTDGYTFDEVEYTFKPNTAILYSKNLITLGCIPEIALNRTFVNNVITGDVALKSKLLGDLVNGSSFPNPAKTQECLSTAISALRSNLSTNGVAQFQATVDICLNKLKSDTNSALGELIGIGFDACKSDFTVLPKTQFTSKSIEVKVNLKEKNGLPLVSGITNEVATNLAARIKSYSTFGKVSNFSYDGYSAFVANITSDVPGSGNINVSFDNNILCVNTIPTDNALPPTHDLQTLDYKFVYTPSVGGTIISTPPVADGDSSEGTPAARDATDLATAGNNQGGKDGS